MDSLPRWNGRLLPEALSQTMKLSLTMNNEAEKRMEGNRVNLSFDDSARNASGFRAHSANVERVVVIVHGDICAR